MDEKERRKLAREKRKTRILGKESQRIGLLTGNVDSLHATSKERESGQLQKATSHTPQHDIVGANSAGKLVDAELPPSPLETHPATKFHSSDDLTCEQVEQTPPLNSTASAMHSSKTQLYTRKSGAIIVNDPSLFLSTVALLTGIIWAIARMDYVASPFLQQSAPTVFYAFAVGSFVMAILKDSYHLALDVVQAVALFLVAATVTCACLQTAGFSLSK